VVGADGNGRGRTFAHEKLLALPLPPHTEYDIQKRVNIVFGKLIPSLAGKTLLDAGCGRGFFTAEAVRRGAEVVALDVGSRLVLSTKLHSKCDGVVADIRQLPFKSCSFDAAVCSEVIEHLDGPKEAIAETFRVITPGGHLALTTPNRLWLPMISLADLLGLRRIGALEKWIWPWELLRVLKTVGYTISKILGFNFLPFFVPAFFGLVTQLDHLGSRLYPFAINIGVAARRPPDHAAVNI